MQDFKNILRSNLIQNSLVNVQNVTNCKSIYWPDVYTLKGKFIRSKPLPILSDYVEIIKELKAKHKYVELCANVMYIQGIAFLIMVSKRLNFITIERLKSRARMEFAEKFDYVFRVYNRAGFVISKIFTDPEFHVLEKEFLDNNIDMECAAAQEHIPEVERTIRVIKERFRV